MTPRTLGENIKAARERKGLTQAQCAKRFPVSQSTWCDWENGAHAPRYRKLPRIAKLLDTDVTTLIS